MAKVVNYEEKKQAVKQKLIEKCESAGCGKEALVFMTNKRTRNLIIKPETTIVADGFVFNLRYSPRFDSPFEDDQDETGSSGLRHIHIEESLRVRPNQRALAMFLFLNPMNSQHGQYVMVDKKQEEEENISLMDTDFAILDKIRSSQIEELRACYNVVTGMDPSGMSSRTLRSDLYILARKSPKKILEAFEDEKTLIKFKLFAAIKEGYIVISTDRLSLSWKGGNSIVNVMPGEDVYNAFAQLCMSENGVETLEILNKRLSQ